MGLAKLWHWDDSYDADAAKNYERGYLEGRASERQRLTQDLINMLQSYPTIDVLLRLKGQLAQINEDRNVPRVNQKGR